MMIEQYTKGNGFDRDILEWNVPEEALRSSLNAEIDRVLSEIMEKLKGNLSRENTGGFSRDKLPFGTTKVSDKEMR